MPFKVGDQLPDGRYVLEVDSDGRVEIVGKTPPKPADEISAAVIAEPSVEEVTVAVKIEEPTTNDERPLSIPIDTTTNHLGRLDLGLGGLVNVKEPEAEDTVSDDPQDPGFENVKNITAEPPPIKRKRGRPKGSKSVNRHRTRRCRRWTPEFVEQCRQRILSGNATYSSIARELKLSVPSVWVPLNRGLTPEKIEEATAS